MVAVAVPLPGFTPSTLAIVPRRTYTAPPLVWNDTARGLYIRVRDLPLGFALHSGLYWLEYLQPEEITIVSGREVFSRAYYRLLCGTDIVGVAHVPQLEDMHNLHRHLAMYLAGLGIHDMSETWIDWPDEVDVPAAHRLPRLFHNTNWSTCYNVQKRGAQMSDYITLKVQKVLIDGTVIEQSGRWDRDAALRHMRKRRHEDRVAPAPPTGKLMCSQCQEWKNRDDFHRDNSRKGRQCKYVCKACSSARFKAYYRAQAKHSRKRRKVSPHSLDNERENRLR